MSVKIHWLSLGCLLLVCAGCGHKGAARHELNERGSALYRKAFAAEQSGDIKEAIRLFNRVLIEEPRAFSAHFQLATLLHDHEEDYISAIYHYKQYLYLRPESEKKTLATDRIRIAEQLLAPQILRKVGDSVQGLSAAHLLQETDRLNRLITAMEGEKSVMQEEKERVEKEMEALANDNRRLRDILAKLRVSEDGTSAPHEPLSKQDEPAENQAAAARTDSKNLRALREEAAAIAKSGESRTETRKPLVDVPSDEEVLQKVKTRLTGEPVPAPPPQSARETSKIEVPGKNDKPDLSAYSIFAKESKRDKDSATNREARTYVVQPGDTLFRVAEKYYGDANLWKRIREANRTRIDPDGRIRAGQIIIIP
ncbi:MAG: LysM peptidoglycan-binding domain-containing protein [Kiritimatiellae bacterium]|nr:LysM peptidoglycan-binding domain-containing protein [Kiritimatiellia bacterium]